jgi:hypothetical protein
MKDRFRIAGAIGAGFDATGRCKNAKQRTPKKIFRKLVNLSRTEGSGEFQPSKTRERFNEIGKSAHTVYRRTS